jgi:hypothetical protein
MDTQEGGKEPPMETPAEGKTPEVGDDAAKQPDAPQAGQKEGESTEDYAARLETELAGLRNKDLNFSKANKLIKAKEKEAEEANAAAKAARTEAERLAEVEEQLKTYREREEKTKSEQFDTMIKQAARGDEVLQAKIKKSYDILNMPEDTLSEMSEKLSAARALAMNTEKAPSPINMAGSMGGAPYRGEAKANFADTAAGKDLRKKMGSKTVDKPKK